MTKAKRDEPATADQLYRQAQHHLRQARELFRAARISGLKAEPIDGPEGFIDFDTLPGRSPRARAEALYMGRRIRDNLFGEDIFGDFAWDILLELFLTRREGEGLYLEEICGFAQSHRSTIVRYISWMTKLGLIEVRSVPERPYSERAKLSRRGHELLSTFFEITDGQIPREGLNLR